MGLRLGLYALLFMVGFITVGLGLISQGNSGQGPGQATAIAATLAAENGNNGGGEPVAVGPAAGAAGAISGSGCAPAGSDTSIASADGRVTVHVFPTMSRSLRFTIVTPVDPAAVPASPGQRVDGLVFQILADDCGDGTVGALSPGPGLLPAEVNLGVRYSDADVGGLNEANFKLAWLDSADNTWKPLAKQAPDPAANYVSATIQTTGYFVVYQ